MQRRRVMALVTRSKFFQAAVLGVALALAVGCGDKKNKKNDNGGGPGMDGGQQAQNVTADLNGAVGVLIIDTQGSGGANLHGIALEGEAGSGSEGEEGGSDPASLVKINEDGEIEPAISAEEQQD